MSQQSAFGRRTAFHPGAPADSVHPVDPIDAVALPSLTDLGFMPTDDRAEVRAYRRGFRWRLLSGMGIWRWVGAGSVGASFLSDHFGLPWTVSTALSAAGIAAFLYGVRRAAKAVGPASESR